MAALASFPDLPSIVRNSFRACGIFPWNFNEIKFVKMITLIFIILAWFQMVSKLQDYEGYFWKNGRGSEDCWGESKETSLRIY